MHRPSNVDDFSSLEKITHTLLGISKKIPLFFPVHPRTDKQLKQFQLYELLDKAQEITLSSPMPYIPFMNLVLHAKMVLTDSGGIQEETTYLGIPCLTLRPNTERPITISQGTNRLCAINNLESAVNDVLKSSNSNQKRPDLWDGNTAKRVIQCIYSMLCISS
ncbi:MAG: hypothetical protein OMM_06518 [Candidatus Magnetoglobus multicellularis str. Araruama]|uniref:UDP-N-acetylglucosamine 2-epimerase domain-containing protein n=1 Tax=Candidatus Magnetoglobus multicellularis str. Araruama TaxID=890399 RepID=A0A1V1PHA6_9BACT|nr:MAG: hypothetical protein OMM_06518 [Candidatus Magnetoglobus multicellularis str. Araruama]